MKKLALIFLLISLIALNINKSYCNDKEINYKLNKFIYNQIKSKEILSYIDCNYDKLQDNKIKEDVINKFINYNKAYIGIYQSDFNLIIKDEIKSIQNKQNLKSEINSLNKLESYEDIYNHRFKFIDNKPNLVKSLKNIYCSGYKVDFESRKFVIKVNYEFFKKAY